MNRKKGFTIIEVLISLAILAIVGVMVGVIFRATQKSFLDSKAFQHVLDLARESVVRMTSEIQETYVDSRGIVNFVGVDSNASITKLNSSGDEVFFVIPFAGSGSGDISEAGFWQRNDGMLMRHTDNDPDFDFSTADGDDELGIVISNLNFQYFDGLNYLDEWDSRKGASQEGLFPQSVKISFSVEDERNTIKKEFNTVVKIASNGR